MKRVGMNWMSAWLVVAVIIIACLACHLGYAQAGQAQSFEDAFRQLQIKQAIDKVEKDIRRRGKLMMDLEREHPDLEELGKAYEKAETAYQEARMQLTETAEYKALRERLTVAEKEYEDLLERHEKDPKVAPKEINIKRNQVEALGRQIRVLQTTGTTVKPLYESMQQAGQAYRSRLNELTRTWKEEDRALIMREASNVFILQKNDVPDFSYLFKDLSQAVPFPVFIERFIKLVQEELLKENPDTDPELAGYVGEILTGRDGSVEKKILKYKGQKVEEDNLKEFFRLMALVSTSPREEWAKLRPQFLSLYNKLQKGNFTRYIIANFLSESIEGKMDRVHQSLADYVARQETLPELFYYLTDYFPVGHSKNGTWMQLRKRLENVAGNLDPWLQHVLNSCDALNKGWNARGGGFSDTVTGEGWKGYEECMKLATKEAEAAIALHPEWPVAYGFLFNANFGDNELILKYLAQICKYRPDLPSLYRRVSWSMLPRWGGSHEEIEALAKACMETRRYDTSIPSIGFCLLGMVSWDDDITRWNRCYRKEWLQPLADELFKEYIKRISPQQPHDARLDYVLFLMAAGRYDDAEKVVKEIGGVKEIMKEDGVSAWNPSNTLGVWHPMMAYWNKMPFTGQYSLFTGVYGETLQALERLAVDDGRTEAAAGRLKDFIKTHELDKEQRSYLVDWYGRLSLAGKQSGSFLAHSNVSGYTWRSAFQVAMTGNYPDIAAALLELGFDYIADEAFPGATAIYLASHGALPETMKMLKDAGDPLNRPEPKDGRQPLHIAAYQFNPTMVKCLVELGCDVNAVDNGRHTPLQMAAADSTTESVECLLKAGAKVELPDYDGDTALIIACQNGSNEDVINLLLDYAKDVNVANRSGLTALHYAVQRNYSKACIEHFLKSGADVLAGDRSGKTAYDYAQGAGRSDLEKLLQPPEGAEVKPPKIQEIPDRPVKAPQRVAKADKNWLLLLCDTKVIVLAIVILVVLAGGGFALLRRRRKG